MVDKTKKLVGEAVEADAIVETRHCLPDAVQLFTPCTVGNGWLKIINWDKFDLMLYDRHDLRGYRMLRVCRILPLKCNRPQYLPLIVYLE